VVVEKGMEHKGEQRQNHNENVGAAAIGKKALFRMKQRCIVKKPSL